jgi:diguanylate cyclase (GGDEF)-like protein/PAS domain S-box-containing protein
MGIFYSLKAKLLVFGLSISLIPLAITTTLSYLNARNAMQRQIMQDLTAVAEFKKAHVLEFLEAKKGRVIDFSSDGFIRDSLEHINSGIINLRQDTITVLNRHLSLNKMSLDPHIVAIEVADMDGKTVASTNETMIGRDVSDQEIYKRAIHAYYNNPCVGQPYHSTYLGANSIDISAPITSRRSSNTIGVLINHYYASFLNKITTQRAGLGETGEVYIVNKDKRMITDSRFIEKAPLKVVVDTEPVRMAVERGENMVGIYPDYRNIPVVGASSYIPGYGWTFLAEIDKAEAFAPLKWLGIFAGIVGGICAAVVSGAGISFLKMALKPLRALSLATTEIAGGNFDTVIPVKTNDEIGDLCKSFNLMVREINKSGLENRQLFLQVKRDRDEWQNTFDSISDLISIQDMDFNIIKCNKAVTDKFNIELKDIVGKKCYEVFHCASKPLLTCPGARCMETSKLETDEITDPHTGSVFLTTAHPEFNEEGRLIHIVHVSRDITERRQAEERIHQLAYYDTLTGLTNRVLYNDRLSLAMVRAQRTKEMLAVLLLDLDLFKEVNDTLGHSIGDQLLKTVAGRLAGSLRNEDTVTRMGGDEFTMLLPGITQVEDVAVIAQKILEVVRKPLMLGGHELIITASIGIAIYPADGKDEEALLKNADTAMYHAKERGRNNYQFFTPALYTRTVEQLEMESSLHHALEREEFIVYYQPQVEIKTGRIVSSEALIRWQHPERGLINPAEFISMAERTGLIVPIGEWALRAACTQNRALQDAGLPPLPVAVNLSARQFQQKNLVEMVEQALKDTGMDPRFLNLEVTESTTMRNVEAANYMMKRLVGIGVHFVIDDLGTGYSSLSYLKTFPICALKIDKSFVQDVVTDSNDAAIVTAIISMAKGLRLRVVAEGVETTAQLEFLRSLGCDEAQGYLFGKPMPAVKFKKMLEQENEDVL